MGGIGKRGKKYFLVTFSELEADTREEAEKLANKAIVDFVEFSSHVFDITYTVTETTKNEN